MGKLFKKYYRQPVTCIFCDVVLANTQNLEGHMNTHTHERPNFCLYCDATFSQKSGQIYHQKTVHFKIKDTCEKCNRKFSIGSNLHAHRRKCKGKRGRWRKTPKKTVLQDRKIANKKCEDSGHNLKRLMSMSPPMMKVGEENNFPNTKTEHVTSIQNKIPRMKYPEYLLVPPENPMIHPPFKLFNATTDSDQKRWDPLFFLHMNRYNMDDPKTTAPDNLRVQKAPPSSTKAGEADEDDDNNSTCRHCGKVYSNKWNLRKHLRLHTGDKQFSCYFCQRTFYDKCNAVRHIAVMHQEGIVNHSSRAGNGNARCGFCGDQFPPGELSQLYKHISSSHDKMLSIST